MFLFLVLSSEWISGLLDFWSITVFLEFSMNPELISGQFHKVSLSRLGFLEDSILSLQAAGFCQCYFDQKIISLQWTIL